MLGDRWMHREGGSESIAAGEMNVNKFVKLCMFVVLHSVKVVGDP